MDVVTAPMAMLLSKKIMKNNKVIATISGGKDSMFAAYKVTQQGYQLSALVNTISQDYRRVRFHGLPAKLIAMQAEALGVPLFQAETTPETYKEEFITNLKRALDNDVSGIVFGDIFLEDCLSWAKEVSEAVGVTALEPHWGRNSTEILKDFIASGFKAVVVSTQASLLPKEWIGRVLNQSFYEEITKLEGIDPCGENGEYHTFVLDGPLFMKRIEITKTQIVERGEYYFLDIQEASFALK